jgi:hypothetical protein
LRFAVATSGFRSPFRSPITTDLGKSPVVRSSRCRKLPSRLFNSTETVSATEFAVTRSGL